MDEIRRRRAGTFFLSFEVAISERMTAAREIAMIAYPNNASEPKYCWYRPPSENHEELKVEDVLFSNPRRLLSVLNQNNAWKVREELISPSDCKITAKGRRSKLRDPSNALTRIESDVSAWINLFAC
jgi:hypothetical protein